MTLKNTSLIPKKRGWGISFVFCYSLMACSYDDIQNNNSLERKIYVVGENNGTAVYWLNGQMTTLHDPGRAIDITISGDDVYILGYASDRQVYMYWKNDVPFEIPCSNCLLSRIAVLNEDVHVVGQSKNSWTPLYFINGIEVNEPLYANDPHGFPGGEADAIAVSEGIVYIVGFIYERFFYDYAEAAHPFLWSKATGAQPFDYLSRPSGIAFSGNDIYISGWFARDHRKVHPGYWKNGHAVWLSEGENGGAANSIALSGNDVYVVGHVNDSYTSQVATYWKNGQQMALKDGSEATDVAVDGNDVFISGYDSPGYWKNGIWVSLANVTAGGTVVGRAYAIAIKK